MRVLMSGVAMAVVIGAATPSAAQTQPPATAHAPSAQATAIAKLDFMRGEWVGPATGVNRDGSRFSITQTERIGPMLGGDILVIEGHGYRDDGTTGFNAFAVVSWDAQSNRYEMRSYAQGYAGTFPFTLTDKGYVWEVPAGPGMMRYEAEVTPTTYHEVGDFVMTGQPPRRSFEMTLTRRGETDWPAAGAVSPAP
ncbi:hypothetical protein BH10PSE1_BH10PSE1_15420 [soil metagenome]